MDRTCEPPSASRRRPAGWTAAAAPAAVPPARVSPSIGGFDAASFRHQDVVAILKHPAAPGARSSCPMPCIRSARLRRGSPSSPSRAARPPVWACRIRSAAIPVECLPLRLRRRLKSLGLQHHHLVPPQLERDVEHGLFVGYGPMTSTAPGAGPSLARRAARISASAAISPLRRSNNSPSRGNMITLAVQR